MLPTLLSNLSQYDVNTDYTVGNMVIFMNRLWVCVLDHKSSLPFTGDIETHNLNVKAYKPKNNFIAWREIL